MKFDKGTLEVTCIDFYPETLVVSWECNLGFGQCEFSYDTRCNKWTIKSEYMSKEFVEALIEKMFANKEIFP